MGTVQSPWYEKRPLWLRVDGCSEGGRPWAARSGASFRPSIGTQLKRSPLISRSLFRPLKRHTWCVPRWCNVLRERDGRSLLELNGNEVNGDLPQLSLLQFLVERQAGYVGELPQCECSHLPPRQSSMLQHLMVPSAVEAAPVEEYGCIELLRKTAVALSGRKFWVSWR
ncbi:hypothetical protein EJ06DRAFT_54450 [Trichodelitschia bisporula]|uniref:Uncharacterized protein n=1 Tax=Trichodelitschia bisporula TaxID=703511 RepID=A0A6G1HUI8_9PEZI|nr:hypothetical protein EJ06DRAFT_54450 [Trichodelitschia bisporula]